MRRNPRRRTTRRRLTPPRRKLRKRRRARRRSLTRRKRKRTTRISPAEGLFCAVLLFRAAAARGACRLPNLFIQTIGLPGRGNSKIVGGGPKRVCFPSAGKRHGGGQA